MTEQMAAINDKHVDALNGICGYTNVFKEEASFQEYGFLKESLPQLMVMPGSREEIEEIVRYANRQALEIVPVGGGTQIAQAAGSLGSQIVVSLRRLDRIHSLETENLSITVGAGVTTDQLQERIQPAKLQLPIPADCFGSTIGGGVAANNSSWKRHRYGAMEDYVLGAAFISPQGKSVKTGGCTVKNVSGYDFTKMLCGSWGTFGILHTLTLKLVPQPEQEIVIEQQFANLEDAFREGVELLAGSGFLSSCNLRCSEKSGGNVFSVIAALEGSREFIEVQLSGMRLSEKWRIDEVENTIAFGDTEHRNFRCALKSVPYCTAVFDRRSIESLQPVTMMLFRHHCLFDLDMSAGVLEFTLPEEHHLRTDFKEEWSEHTTAIHGMSDNVAGQSPSPLFERLKPAVDPLGIMFSSNTLLGRDKRG